MWGIKVKVWNPNTQDYAWFWLRPTGGSRYEWDSIESAQKTKEMCYPQTTSEWVKVVEITESEK